MDTTVRSWAVERPGPVAGGPLRPRRGARAPGRRLRRTCGECRWCREGRENLCPRSEYTGWDADGGFAEYAVVPAAYAYRLPAARRPTARSCWRSPPGSTSGPG